eukprot:CAMPEP_0194444438 /NCGR_PEP_ID=MMETSP0176-20130528/127272_1 /TAXON_ID=216777 /ORGANISM="Proboscia alata, Strain PI-D3" /LENGTH=52 /DNA_ID=CAMNT_0039270815 /DNA_START=968 /DNA_END=1126 /DNA_ORIENTATION=-
MKVEPGETPLGTVAATVHPLSSGALTWITWPGETPVGTVTETSLGPSIEEFW